jgi:tetratricopeptide (TPR) repeat protein
MPFGIFRNNAYIALLLAVLSTAAVSPALFAQANDDPQSLKQKIDTLVKQENYVEALPLLEKLVLIEPNDHETHLRLGFALLGKTNVTQEAETRKALRIRARAEFAKAKELGDKHPIVDALVDSIPADGSEGAAFSGNKQASALMDEAEAFFAQGKLDEALADYQKALLLDPKLYDAAVFSGDVYTNRKDWANAEIWYQKAIAIDPTREKAYRYSATPFMKQGKYDVARDRYVEAFITEPYSRFSRAGLGQWSAITKTTVGHPTIEIPGNFRLDEKGAAQIEIDPATLLGGKNDGSSAWIVYGGTRALWHKEKFAERFPAEKSYRHSLDEEADALRTVLRAAAADKQVKHLSPSLAKLKEIDDKGLLEAYILLARPDDGIAADHPRYLAQHRDKLRRYVVDYVLTNGGK